MAVVNMDNTYGSLLIGTFFSIFFQGIVHIQAYIYYESFPNDSWVLKTLVAVVWFLDLADLILICQSMYHYFVTNWGNTAALAVSTEPLDLHLVFVSAATILCQGFFLHRVHTFSKQNWLLTGFLGLASLGSAGLAILHTIQTSRNKSVAIFATLGKDIVAMFSLGAGVDLIIAMLLVYHISRGRGGFERTNTILSRIIRYTVATGLATSLLAIASIAAYVIQSDSFVYIAIHLSLGRMYTNALLATLNLRRNLRSILGQPEGTGIWFAPITQSTASAPAIAVSGTPMTEYQRDIHAKGSWEPTV